VQLCAEDGAHFDLRQMLADGVVRPDTKRERFRRAVADIESVRILELAFVPVLRD
jgi:hypothetical protein